VSFFIRERHRSSTRCGVNLWAVGDGEKMPKNFRAILDSSLDKAGISVTLMQERVTDWIGVIQEQFYQW